MLESISCTNFEKLNHDCEMSCYTESMLKKILCSLNTLSICYNFYGSSILLTVLTNVFNGIPIRVLMVSFIMPYRFSEALIDSYKIPNVTSLKNTIFSILSFTRSSSIIIYIKSFRWIGNDHP